MESKGNGTKKQKGELAITFLDIFAGIGGFRLGMEAAGHKCKGFIEIDKFAVKSYTAIHNTEEEFYANDIRNIDPNDLPEFQCICGGFPCQAFSIAGARRGFEDTRGTLIYEVLRIAAHKKPRILFLENVAGLLTHDRGKTFTTILRAISELGYVCEWQCINSKAYLPQNRNRVYIIGHFGELPRQTVFPIERADGKTNIKIIGDSDISGWLDCGKRIHSVRGVSPTITTISQSPIICYDEWSNKPLILNADMAYTVTTKIEHKQFVMQNCKIRRLTPRECWRLQGFPDWAFEKAERVNTKGQLYKQAGNSVTVPVIEEIAKRLKTIE